MDKKNIYNLLFIFLLCLPLTINAEYDANISDNYVRIRSKATTDGDKLYTVNKGTSISVIDKTLYNGKGCDDGWYKIKYKDKTGYVCSTYVNFIDKTFDEINVVDWTARINTNNVTTKKEATTKSDSVSTLSLGTNVEILSTKNATNSGCSTNKWYKIQYYTNKTAYICSKYVTTKKSITSTDTEYEKTLKEAGFPDSYIPYLTYLHQKYPSWTFIPKNTNSLFASAVDAEEGLNYMQTKNDNYRTSSVPAEASSWFRVNEGVIAFYMDPRNWLTEERIFMFEKLDYAESYDEQYPALIKALFGDGKLGQDEYTTPMYKYGKQYKVSPLHIGSRIRLEVGKNGSGSTDGKEFTFKGKKYSGYYNFFNIGAYEQTIDGVEYSTITMGLVTAMNKGWNTIDKAIEGGVQFLANGYITKGQGTLYYQKFNVSPDAEPYSTKYLHQYMTNIQAPATEGNQSYNSYKSSNILENPFLFEIPVYNKMPEYTSLPASGDNNNNLKTLEVEGFKIEPEFDKDVLTYEAFITEDTKKVNIIAKTESKDASISGIGSIETEDDKTDVAIIVKPEVGESKKYTLSIIKIKNNSENNNDDNNIDNNTNNGNENSNEEENNKTNENTNADNKENSTTTENKQEQITNNEDNKENQDDLKDNNKTEENNNEEEQTIKTISNILKDSNINVSNKSITNIKYNSKASTIMNNLTKNGASKVTINNKSNKEINGNTLIGTGSKVTLTNNDSTETYTFTINGDTSGDGQITILDLLQVQKHIRGDKKLKNEYLNAADVSGDQKVTILDLLKIQKHLQGDKKL